METSLKSNIDSQLIRKSKKLFKEQIIALNRDASLRVEHIQKIYEAFSLARVMNIK